MQRKKKTYLSEAAIKSIQSITKTDQLSSFYNRVFIEEHRSADQQLQAKQISKLFPSFEWIFHLPSTMVEALATDGPFEIKLFILLNTRNMHNPPVSIDTQYAAYAEGLKQTDAENAIAIFEVISQRHHSSQEQKRGALLRLGGLYLQKNNQEKALECYQKLLNDHYSDLDPFSRRELAQQLARITKEDSSLENLLLTQFDIELNRPKSCIHVLNAIVEGSSNKNLLLEKIFSKSKLLFIDKYETKGPYHRREAIEFFTSLPEDIVKKDLNHHSNIIYYLLENELQHRNINPKNIELLIDACIQSEIFHEKAKLLPVLNAINHLYQNIHPNKKEDNYKNNLAINKILEKLLEKTPFNDDVIECLFKNFSIETHFKWPIRENIELLCQVFEKYKLYENTQFVKKFLESFSKLKHLNLKELEAAYQLISNLPKDHHFNPKTRADILKRLGNETRKKEYYLEAGDAEGLFAAAKMTEENKNDSEKLDLCDKALKAAWKENNNELFEDIIKYIMSDCLHEQGRFYNAQQMTAVKESIFYAYSMLALKEDDAEFQKRLLELALSDLPLDSNFRIEKIMDFLMPYFNYNHKFLKFAYEYTDHNKSFNPFQLDQVEQEIDKQFEVKNAADGIKNIAHFFMTHQEYLKPHSDIKDYILQKTLNFIRKYIDRKKITKNDFNPLFNLSPSLKYFLLVGIVNQLECDKVTKDNIFQSELNFLLLSEILKKQDHFYQPSSDAVNKWIETIKLLPESPAREELVTSLMLHNVDKSSKTNIMMISKFDVEMSESNITNAALARLGLPLPLINRSIDKLSNDFSHDTTKLYVAAMMKIANLTPIMIGKNNQDEKILTLCRNINKQLPIATEKADACFATLHSKYNNLICFYEAAIAEYLKSSIQNPHAFLLMYLNQHVVDNKIRIQVLKGMKHALGFHDVTNFNQWIEKLNVIDKRNQNLSRSISTPLSASRAQMNVSKNGECKSSLPDVIRITPGQELSARYSKEGDLYLTSQSGLFKTIHKSDIVNNQRLVLKLDRSG